MNKVIRISACDDGAYFFDYSSIPEPKYTTTMSKELHDMWVEGIKQWLKSSICKTMTKQKVLRLITKTNEYRMKTILEEALKKKAKCSFKTDGENAFLEIEIDPTCWYSRDWGVRYL